MPQDEANDVTNPSVSDPLPDELKNLTPEEILEFAKRSIPQRKGLQKRNDAYRTEQQAGIKTEALEKNIDLTNQKIDAFIEAFKNSPLNDEDTAASLKAIQDKTAQVRDELSSETTVREEIADVLGKHGLDYDDDTPQAEVLRAHYGSGDYDKVRTTLKKIEDEHTTSDIETRVKAGVEETLRKKGLAVDTSSGGGGTPPEEKARILLDLEKGDITGNQALAAAMALANK